MFYSGDVTLAGNDLYENHAWESGGGIFTLVSSDLILTHNDIHANEGTDGGGIYLLGSSGDVEGNRIHDNVGGEGDSAVHVANGGPVTLTRNLVYGNGACGGELVVWLADNGAPIYLINNVVADNTAGGVPGIVVDNSTAYLVHNTLAHNLSPYGNNPAAVGVVDGGRAVMTNTIVVSHEVGILATSGSTATLEATLWGADEWANGKDWDGTGTIVTGTHNFWGDPAFLAPDAGNYHIAAGSAARDRGIDAGVTVDIDGDARPSGAKPDLGADEVVPVYLPLVLRSYP